MTTLCAECERITDGAMLCGTCTNALAKTLGDLPGLLSDLRGVVVRQARVHRTVGAPREPDPDWRGGEYALIRTPWAYGVDASQELDRVGNELAGWVQHLCESRIVDLADVPVPRRTLHIERNRMYVLMPGQDVGCAQWLLGHLESIRLDEAAGEIMTEITQLRADLMRAVDNSPSPFYAGPCHAVNDDIVSSVRGGTVYVSKIGRRCELDLYAWVNPWDTERDDAKITCKGWRSDEDGCGTVHTVADRQDWLLDSIEDELLPLEVWRRSLPKMLDTLKWPHRTWWMRLGNPDGPRRLLPRSVDRHGRELFRGGDVLDLIERDQSRIVAARTRESVRKVMR